MRQRVAFLLWPDSSEAQAQSNLRNLVFQLRHSLPEAEKFLRTEGRTLQWNSDARYSLDVERFEGAVARARAEPEEGELAAERALKDAADTYRGDLLPGYYDEWIFTERERLHLMASQSFSRLIELLEQKRDYAGAIEYSQRLIRHDPLDEGAYRTLMRLHSLNGDQAAALRTYHQCASVLERELGVEPAQATREVYERLLRAGSAVVEAKSAVAARQGESKLELVGRRGEWARLQAEWRVAAKGGPRAVLLTGEAGIGKTRLAEDLSAWASRQGISTAVARCYAAERSLPYGPVADWLRALPAARLERMAPLWLSEIARLLPELLVERPELPPPGPLTERWQLQRLHEALARALLGSQPLLLVLDDIQWSDQESIAFISYLFRFDSAARLLLVMTARAEELVSAVAEPVEGLMSAIRRDGVLVELEPGPLGAEETAALARQLTQNSLSGTAAAELFAETEGNPLFVVEMVRAGLAAHERRGEPRDATSVSARSLPPAVRAAIDSRLSRLTPQARDVAAVAAVIGREFTFALLGRAAGVGDDDLVRALDELWRRRVVREQGPDSYDFSHDKLREVTYEGLSEARRRQLHLKAAVALEEVSGSDRDAVSAQIGAHYERAGLGALAAPYYVRAADAARRIFANPEAIGYYRRALEMMGAAGEAAAPVREHLGDLLDLSGRHGEAFEEFSRALADVARAGGMAPAEGLHKARLLRKAGKSLNGLGRYAEAASLFAEAEALLGTPDDVTPPEQVHEWIEVQFVRSRMLYGQADHEGTARLLELVRPVVAKHGTPQQKSSLAAHWSNMVLRRDRYVISKELVEIDRQALAEIEKRGDTAQEAAARFRLGFKLLFHGDYDEAVSLFESAEQLHRQLGDLDGRVLSLTYLSVTHRRAGRVEAARRGAEVALEAATHAQAVSYMGAAHANLGWATWRGGEHARALDHCSTAFELWQQTSYPFRWLAAFPLMVISLQQGSAARTADCLRIVLDPMQQRLPDELERAAVEALDHLEGGRPAGAGEALARTVQLAREHDFL